MAGKKEFYIITAVIISGFLVFGITSGAFANILFDQIPYDYTSYLSIPPNSPHEASIDGYYKIHGKGHGFNFLIVIPGGEDQESPLDYTKDGLKGTGKINNIGITYSTIIALVSGKFKDAIFDTKFDGTFNMACAAWTGYGDFRNDGQNFIGNFKIDGQMTDWEGTINFVQENNRIALKTDYILYPHDNKTPESIKEVKKTYYM